MYDFRKLDAYLDSLRDKGICGCGISVARDGEILFRKDYGFDDGALTRPTSSRTVYPLYSMTKVVTSCAAMQLIERGLLGLDDPVAKWLPAYETVTVRTPDGPKKAERVMTVRHLLAMQGGLDYDLNAPEIRRAIEAAGGNPDTRQIADALAARPLSFEPGTRFQYSLCHDVLAAVIEAAAERRFSEQVKREIFDPLGISGMVFHPADLPASARLAALWICDPATGIPRRQEYPLGFIFSERYESGGAGLFGSCDEYMKLASALSCEKLLKPETIALWHTDQMNSPACRADFQLIEKKGYSYGLGVRTNVTPGQRHPLGEFGWDGAAGSYVLIDTANRLAIVYTQNILNCRFAYVSVHPTLRDLTYEILAPDPGCA